MPASQEKLLCCVCHVPVSESQAFLRVLAALAQPWVPCATQTSAPIHRPPAMQYRSSGWTLVVAKDLSKVHQQSQAPIPASAHRQASQRMQLMPRSMCNLAGPWPGTSPCPDVSSHAGCSRPRELPKRLSLLHRQRDFLRRETSARTMGCNFLTGGYRKRQHRMSFSSTWHCE